jgi:PRC-barrel domain
MPTKEYVYNDHLKELSASDFEIKHGEHDIRNWKVVTAQNQEIGRISELLFDEVSRRVRYVIVDLNGKPLNLISRPVIIPVGLAVLHEKEKVVSFPGLTAGHIASLPSYDKGKITIENEMEIRSVFAPTNGLTYHDEDFNDRDTVYKREHLSENNNIRYGREVVEKNSLKDEIKENIEKVKESVRKMENDIEKLGKN